MSSVLGLDEAIAAGAVICGAYFGDKMTPLSETTVLVPKLVGGGLTVGEHVRNMFWTAGPALGVSLVIFFFLGRAADPDAAVSTDEAREALGSVFNITFLNLLPLLLLVVFAAMKMPPFLSILGSALFAAILAPFLQWDAVVQFVDDPELGKVGTAIEAGYAAMATGFVSDSGLEQVDDLFSRGGMASMLTTIWLVLGALSFAAVMEHAGFLQRLLEPIVRRTRRRGSLIAAVTSSGVGLNVIAGDQYVADVLPARMFRGEFARRGLAPRCSPARSRTRARSPPCWCRGTRAVPTSPVCWGCRQRPTCRSASSTCSARCSTSCTASSASRCPRRPRTGKTTPRPPPPRQSPEETPCPNPRATTTVEPRRRFTLPSAYTILFGLIVVMALATWLIPAGTYALDKEGAPVPGTYHTVDSHPARILTDSLTAPINGLYGIEDDKGNISYYNSGELFGAIDVALFIIVIGGFLGVTMRTGRHPERDRQTGQPSAWTRALDDPDPDDRSSLSAARHTAWPRRASPSTRSSLRS